MSATAVVKDLTALPKDIIAEIKSEAKPATKDGTLNQAVGFALGIPISMLYDFLYNLVATKAITNDIARDIIKVALPLSIGVIVQVAKIPFGNLIAGTGYGVAIVSAGRILWTRLKGLFGKTTKTSGTDAVAPDVFDAVDLWGVQ